MNDYISSQVHKLIAEVDQRQLTEDLMQDLKEMDMSRIAGLGITADQLDHWLESVNN